MAIEYEVRHAIRGRMRVNVPAIRRIEGLGEAFLQMLSTQGGVADVRLNRGAASLVINYDAERSDLPTKIEKAIGSATIPRLLSLPAPPSPDTEQAPAGDTVLNAFSSTVLRNLRENRLLLPSVSLGLSLLSGPAGMAVALPLIGYNALPILKRALNVLRYEHRLNVDFLDSLAITISTFQGNLFTSAFMTWLIGLGDFIRDKTAGKSKRAITDLLDYQGRKAWVLRGKKKVELPVGEIVVGDTVVVYAGGLIPVDGIVIHGNASVDQKTITGESLPVERRVGDKVYAATVVKDGKVYLRAERVGAETTAAQIVRLVEEAPIGETRIQNYAEKFADRLVAPMLATAGGFYAMSRDVNRFVSMVVVDYGTGIRVAAPTSVLAAMTHAARQGILIKGGSQLEKLNKVDTIVFDKTGTLTAGEPRVLNINSYDERRFSPRKVLALAAAAEARMTHPVAQAVLAKARETHVQIPERAESRYFIGLGVEVQVNGYSIHIGSERFLREKGIKLDGAVTDLKWLNGHGYSALLLAIDGKLTGYISYADQIRIESSAVIKTLHNRGVRNLIMMTGDNRAVAGRVATQLGLDKYYAEVFPAEKAEVVRHLQQKGRVVAMVGDGINDSPALAHADVGIAMKNGADIAQEAADVVLMEENLWKLINAIDISKDAMGLIRQNFAIIAGFNTLAFGLAIPSGLVSPSLTTLISNGSAILASLNAIRPILRY